jgi:hypothetical protein
MNPSPSTDRRYRDFKIVFFYIKPVLMQPVLEVIKRPVLGTKSLG